MEKSIFGKKKDAHFMRAAFKQAQKAFEQNEVPIGAVVVNKHGKIIGRGYNQVEKKHSQTAHAEIDAIKKATKKMGNWRLENCWLYVTLQPCSMCMGLIKLSRIAGVVFGAPSPLFGYHLDNGKGSRVYKNDTIVIDGINHDEAAQLLKRFFKIKREDKKGESYKKKSRSS